MRSRARLYNLLTALVAGMTVLVAMAMAAIFIDPNVFFNPFKPASVGDIPVLLTAIPTVPTATPADTLRAPSPAKTATPTLPASATAPEGGTGVATFTPFPSPVGPTGTTTPTEIPTQTPTLRPPTPSATRQSYPVGPTDTPQSTAYP